MPASYEGLIADHAAIDHRADLLIEDLKRYSQSDAGKAADDLCQLARLVRRHIEEEQAILATLDGRADIERWGASWTEVYASFETLRIQWIDFLSTSLVNIASFAMVEGGAASCEQLERRGAA